MIWTSTGTVDLAATQTYGGDHYWNIGGNLALTSNTKSVAGWTQPITLNTKIGELGALEAGDYIKIEVNPDGAGWQQVFSKNNDFGTVLNRSFDLSALGINPTSTIAVRYLISNNTSGGTGGGATEAVRIYNTQIIGS